MEEVRTLKEAQKDTAEKLDSVSVEKGRRLDEMTTNMSSLQENQQRFQRRLEEIEIRPAATGTGSGVNKELVYNGEESFPMEFLKELTEIQEVYYPMENTKWIGKHLTGEAGIWWRIVKDQVNTFEEFREVFTEKYWGAIQQERVRDQLEYGKFRPNGSLTMVQYLERKVLECRQLIPIMSDRHLIKKLARHYEREIQIAVITRGIVNISSFENLLKEYMSIAPRMYNREVNDRQAVKAENNSKQPRDQQSKPRAQWNGGYKPTTRPDNKPVINIVTTDRPQANVNNREAIPSTSKERAD